MLEIAGGVVLGGIVLFILAALAEPLLKLAAWVVGIGIVVTTFAVIVLLCAGEFPGLRNGLLGLAMFAGVIAMVGEIFNGFQMTRAACRWARGKLKGYASPQEPLPNVKHVQRLGETVTWVDSTYASTDKWKRLMDMAMSGPDVFGVRIDISGGDMEVMRALSVADRCRNLTYEATGGCVYVWKRRDGER